MESETQEIAGRGLAGTIWIGLLGVVLSAGVNLLTSLADAEWVHRWRWWLTAIVFLAVLIPTLLQRKRLAGMPGLRAVAAVDVGDGSMEVVAATVAGAVMSATFRESGSWSRWVDCAAESASWDVAAVVPRRDTIEYFAVDRDGVLRSRTRDRSEWSAWRVVRPGGFSRGRLLRIASATLEPGHREVYAATDTERLVHAWKWDGQPWSDWYDAGLGSCIDVAVCSPKNGRLEMFAVDQDGDVWHRWYWEGWKDWENWGRPGSPAKAVSAFRRAHDRQEMFVVGKAGDLGHRWHQGGEPWSGWALMETPSDLNDVAASTTSANRLQCLSLDQHGHLWLRSFDGAWGAWQRVGR